MLLQRHDMRLCSRLATMLGLSLSLSLSLSACQSGRHDGHNAANRAEMAYKTGGEDPAEPGAPRGISLAAFLDKAFEEELNLSPERKGWLGQKDRQGELDDASPAQQERYFALAQKQLSALRTFSRASLSADEQLNYDLFELKLQQKLAGYPFRFHNFPVNQMFGVQSELPSFMINVHRVSSEGDLRNYLSRLRQFQRKFAEVEVGLQLRADQGIVLPKFLFPHVLRDCRNMISGHPFDQGRGSSPLFEDFMKKLASLRLPREKASLYEAEAKEALLASVGPAYKGLMSRLEKLEAQAPLQGGAGSLPEGAAFYQYALTDENSTELSAEAIHSIGQREVTRIQGEMQSIIDKLGFKGDLQAFFRHVRKDERFYYPNSEEGRKAYLTASSQLLDAMQKRLPEFFSEIPPQKLEVKPVEPYRAASAGAAFYSQPSEDGQRPGIYYVNLHEMRQVPRYEMEALAYHEGVPGHHLQLSASQNLKNLPRFRRFGDQTAYTEGWGLYAEKFPKDAGFYRDPYSDFGRLSMELWRAARLVVDTGIHARSWTREQAIQYLAEHTPADASEISNSVERYIVMPAQATAYMLGSLKILELREQAIKVQGDRFSLKNFHDEILKRGPLPLSVLEKQVKKSMQLEPAAVALGSP